MRNFGQTMIPRVNAEELKFAMGVACAALAMKGPYPTPSVQHFTMQDDDTGDVMTYRFANQAVARGGFAVMQQFEQEPSKGVALLMRWSELTRLIQDPRMRPYMREASDGSGAVDLRPEVLEVAAELSLNGDKGFDEHTFFRTLDVRVTSGRCTPPADACDGAAAGQGGGRRGGGDGATRQRSARERRQMRPQPVVTE
jgi:hypothetical protein